MSSAELGTKIDCAGPSEIYQLMCPGFHLFKSDHPNIYQAENCL
jgi:hypothetical protein